MKMKFKTAKETWTNMFNKVIATCNLVDGATIEDSFIKYAYEGLELIPKVLDTKHPSYKEKERLNYCIHQCLIGSLRDLKSKDEIDNILKKHTDKLDQLVPTMPIDPETRKGLVEKIAQLRDKIINAVYFTEEAKQRAFGLLVAFTNIVTSEISNVTEKRKFHKACKIKRNNQLPYINGSIDSSADPQLLHILCEVLSSIPEIFENRFYRHIIVENIFLDYIYRKMSKGSTVEEAIKETFSHIASLPPSMLCYLQNMIDEILKMADKVKDLIVCKDDNKLAIYQLETGYRVMISDSRCMFIFDEAGTRKSISSGYSTILKLRMDGYTKAKIIIVCPKNCIDTWIHEISYRLNPDLVSVHNIHEDIRLNDRIEVQSEAPFQFYVVGKNTFSNNKWKNLKEYDAAIIDEGHHLKERDNTTPSKCSRNIIAFLRERNISYRHVLTGTPVINDISEYVNMIASFSENPSLVDKIKSISGSLEKCCYLHAVTSDIVIRRRKDSLFNLEKLNVEQIEIDVDKKELLKINKINVSSLPHIAVAESQFKKHLALKTYGRFKDSKGLVFSSYIMGGNNDAGILRQYFDECPSNRGKIYIAGDGICDLDGNWMEYNISNASMVRKQFLKSKGYPIAFVSLKTCSEGINEFRCADFVFFAILPYDDASLEQAKSRIYRDGRDENKACTVIIPIVCYRNKDGQCFYNNNRIVESFDECCLRLIKSKKNISNACCDGIKKTFEGDLISWGEDIQMPFDSVISTWANGIDNIKRGNKGLALINGICDLQRMNQSDDVAMIEKIEKINLSLELSNPNTKGFFAEMENDAPAKSSNKLFNNIVSEKLEGNNNEILYVGCGMSKISKNVKSKGVIHLVDKYCEREDAIMCDRKEVSSYFEKSSLNFVFASNIMHWGVDIENLSETMISFNEVLINDGYCLLTAPQSWSFPFAENQTYLNSIGFNIVDVGNYEASNYYLLKKTKDIKKHKYMTKSNLPKKSS